MHRFAFWPVLISAILSTISASAGPNISTKPKVALSGAPIAQVETGPKLGVSSGIDPTVKPPTEAPRDRRSDDDDEDEEPEGMRRLPTKRHGSPPTSVVAEASFPLPSPPPLSSFTTNLYAPDATIAVGKDVIVAASSSTLTFYDKKGVMLAPKHNLGTTMSMLNFFGGFFADKLPNGSVNTQNLNRILALPATPNYPACDPANYKAQPSCVQEVYDSRVQFDPSRNRFWVQAAARPLIWKNKPPAAETDELYRRFILVAVSKTEDPRDGFCQYVLVDEYADWPRMTIHGKRLVLSHQGGKKVFVFDADKLAAGNPGAGPVLVQKFLESSFPESQVLAQVTHHGNVDATYMLGIGDGGKSWTAYAIVPGAPGGGVQLLKTTFTTPDREGIWVRNNPIYRDGKLYITGGDCEEWDDLAKNKKGYCRRELVRVLRVPLARSGNKLTVSKDTALGYLDISFGNRGPGDDPSDRVSYSVPALEVTKTGEMVLAYTRVGQMTAKPLFPEARYSVFLHDKPTPHRSALIRAGNSLVSTVITGGGVIDLTGAAIDPVDDTTVWAIVPYAFNGGYRFTIAQLKP